MRGRLTDIATSRAFIPPWSLAGALNEGERQDRIALGPSIVRMKRSTGTLAILKMMQITSHLSLRS
jgi:hypothetical protein